jgi:RimJ/RimL family protein N-acetyltransferase
MEDKFMKHEILNNIEVIKTYGRQKNNKSIDLKFIYNDDIIWEFKIEGNEYFDEVMETGEGIYRIISYKLIDKYRGKNLGFDLFKKSINIVFNEDDIKKIYSYNNERNRNSNRLWNKLSENGYIVNKDENFYSVER